MSEEKKGPLGLVERRRTAIIGIDLPVTPAKYLHYFEMALKQDPDVIVIGPADKIQALYENKAEMQRVIASAEPHESGVRVAPIR
ncbi:hypothetical protein ACI2KR_06610 [Pseudomonas luteola]